MVSGYKKSEIGLVPNDWDVLPFGEVFRTLSNNTLSRDQLNYDSGSIKDVHYGDVLILFPELLDCSRDDIPYVNSDAPLSCQSLQEGDVIISDTAEDETVGKAVEIVNQGKTNIVAGLHTIPCRVKNGKFASGWLGYFINSHYYHDQLLPYIHGTKVSSIARKSLADTYIVKPSYEEQKRIVKALSDIGRLISESEELIAKYQAMKQGCLQHMFPRKVQTEPDMRLPGFSGDWEQRKLRELGKALSGVGFPDEEQGGKEGIPFYKVSDMNNAGNEQEMVTANNYVTSEQIARKRWKPIDEVPAIFFAKVGAAVLLNRKRLCRFPFLFDNNTMAYLMNKNVFDADFAKTLFETIDLTSLVQVGALPSYNAGDVEGIEVSIPKMEEQQKIGFFFINIDHLIALHQRKCEKYKMIKQGMMEDLLTGKVRLK